MQKFSKILSLAALACVLSYSLTFCENQNQNQSHNQNPPVPATRPEVSGKIGIYESPYETGDILFSDGSAIPYSTELTLTAAQKENAVAIIYKVSNSTAYGTGLVHKETVAWCLSSANAHNTDITTIHDSVDTDGSDNLTQIRQALIAAGKQNDTGTLSKYPAFEFAVKYANQTGTHVRGTDYETSWYLPTTAELRDIFRVKTMVNGALGLCEGDLFGGDYFWSSNQDSSKAERALLFGFYSNGNIYYAQKSDTRYKFACAIRQF